MKLFYYDELNNEEANDKEATIEIALDDFYKLSDNEKSFFGIINKKGEVIQFTWEDEDTWLIDIPYDVENKKSLQKHGNYEECVRIIKLIFQGISVRDLKGFKLENM